LNRRENEAGDSYLREREVARESERSEREREDAREREADRDSRVSEREEAERNLISNFDFRVLVIFWFLVQFTVNRFYI
jgi:hypothetical protein